MTNTSEPFSLTVSDLGTVGGQLHRPECVLATARGELYVSDRRGGITRIGPNGAQELIGGGGDVLPNGIALMPDGSFLLANLTGAGGVWRLERDGRLEPFLLEVDGIALSAVNFVRLDEAGRVWICANPALGQDGRYRTEAAEGFIAVVDKGAARIVADGIGWANECLVHPSGQHLFVNETFGRRLSRFDLNREATLTNRTTVAEFGHGTYPDGLALDEENAIWVVSITSNRLIRVRPDGSQQVVVEDSDSARLEHLETLYRAHRLTRQELTAPTTATLKNITSIAFGGPDRRTAYLGSIGGDRLLTFRSPVAGAAPVHWTW